MSRSDSILLVDGDHAVRQRCRELLESAGYMVFESPGASHARMFLRTITPAAIIWPQCAATVCVFTARKGIFG